jgi:CHAT domain-containing protein
MEDYEIVYAPSLDALTMTREQLAEAASAPTLAVVVNPLGDLPGAEKEGKLVASYFPAQARTVQVRSKATPEAVLAALKGKTYWHFASHGTFSWDDARQSGLYMSGRKVLTVGRLLETNDLGRPRLVVLSACETGLYDIKRSPDEFIGLPGAFTALGAAGVLSTLWPVDDTATALLIAKFYELHLGTGLSPPAALRRAQLWLRHATNWDLQAYARGAARQGRLESRHLSDIEAKLSEEGLTHSRNAATIQWVAPAGRDPGGKRSAAAKALARPYGHPYYWAGFIYTGL